MENRRLLSFYRGSLHHISRMWLIARAFELNTISSNSECQYSKFSIVSVTYLPKGTVPVIANSPLGNKSILHSDFDGDSKMESVILYQSLNNTRDVGAIVLKEKGGGFEKIFSRKGPGYEISYASTNDLTGDGHDELLIGWKIGNRAGNVLEIYTWKNKEFNLLGNRTFMNWKSYALKEKRLIDWRFGRKK